MIPKIVRILFRTKNALENTFSASLENPCGDENFKPPNLGENPDQVPQYFFFFGRQKSLFHL